MEEKDKMQARQLRVKHHNESLVQYNIPSNIPVYSIATSYETSTIVMQILTHSELKS